MKNPKRLRNMIIFIVIFIGALFLLYPRNIVIYGLSDGTYATADTEDNDLLQITWDLQEYRFILRDHGTCLQEGTFDLKDGMIIAATDDGKYIYRFRVLDNDTLTFVQHGSICPKNLSIDDETEFKYVEAVP